MMIRAPRMSDFLWFAMFAFMIAGFRMIFAPDANVPCPEGTGCNAAYVQSGSGETK